jgi:hypothetical protein
MSASEALQGGLRMLSDPTLSSCREQLIEYAFVSELLQDGWFRRQQKIDVLRADVDGAGYDLLLECQGVHRHVQMKSTVAGGRRKRQGVHVALAAQRCGAVVWVVLEPDGLGMRLSYLAFGAEVGSPLPVIMQFPPVKHSRGNATGFKAERPNLRKVPMSAFRSYPTISGLSNWLFGPPRPSVHAGPAAGEIVDETYGDDAEEEP